jgi:hypothetical protein
MRADEHWLLPTKTTTINISNPIFGFQTKVQPNIHEIQHPTGNWVFFSMMLFCIWHWISAPGRFTIPPILSSIYSVHYSVLVSVWAHNVFLFFLRRISAPTSSRTSSGNGKKSIQMIFRFVCSLQTLIGSSHTHISCMNIHIVQADKNNLLSHKIIKLGSSGKRSTMKHTGLFLDFMHHWDWDSCTRRVILRKLHFAQCRTT